MVQRIMNSSTHESIGISPAQLLFGNAIQLDRDIFTKEGVKEKVHSDIRGWVDNMLAIQSHSLRVASNMQSEKDKAHMAQTIGSITEFEKDSYVLVRYRVWVISHHPNCTVSGEVRCG
jgi:hypothetical protein